MMEAIALVQYPGLWSALPDTVKAEAIRKAAEDAPVTIKAMMTDIKRNIGTVFDLKHMVVTAFTTDKALLNYMFLKCGEKELNYIKVLGAYIGFVLGSLQMIVWIFYRVFNYYRLLCYILHCIAFHCIFDDVLNTPVP